MPEFKYEDAVTAPTLKKMLMDLTAASADMLAKPTPAGLKLLKEETRRAHALLVSLTDGT